MKAVRHVGVERHENVRLRDADLAHELLTQLEALDQLGIGVAKKGDTCHTQHIGCELLLAFTSPRHLRAGRTRVAGTFVS